MKVKLKNSALIPLHPFHAELDMRRKKEAELRKSAEWACETGKVAKPPPVRIKVATTPLSENLNKSSIFTMNFEEKKDGKSTGSTVISGPPLGFAAGSTSSHVGSKSSPATVAALKETVEKVTLMKANTEDDRLLDNIEGMKDPALPPVLQQAVSSGPGPGIWKDPDGCGQEKVHSDLPINEKTESLNIWQIPGKRDGNELENVWHLKSQEELVTAEKALMKAIQAEDSSRKKVLKKIVLPEGSKKVESRKMNLDGFKLAASTLEAEAPKAASAKATKSSFRERFSLKKKQSSDTARPTSPNRSRKSNSNGPEKSAKARPRAKPMDQRQPHKAVQQQPRRVDSASPKRKSSESVKGFAPKNQPRDYVKYEMEEAKARLKARGYGKDRQLHFKRPTCPNVQAKSEEREREPSYPIVSKFAQERKKALEKRYRELRAKKAEKGNDSAGDGVVGGAIGAAHLKTRPKFSFLKKKEGDQESGDKPVDEDKPEPEKVNLITDERIKVESEDGEPFEFPRLVEEDEDVCGFGVEEKDKQPMLDIPVHVGGKNVEEKVEATVSRLVYALTEKYASSGDEPSPVHELWGGPGSKDQFEKSNVQEEEDEDKMKSFISSLPKAEDRSTPVSEVWEQPARHKCLLEFEAHKTVEFFNRMKCNVFPTRQCQKLWAQQYIQREDFYEREAFKMNKFLSEIFNMGRSPPEPPKPCDTDFPDCGQDICGAADAESKTALLGDRKKFSGLLGSCDDDLKLDYDYYDYDDDFDLDEYEDYIILTESSAVDSRRECGRREGGPREAKPH